MVRRLISCCMALLMLGCALAEDKLDITYRFGSREEQKIAVTIDDCYHADDVRAVLDILQANDVRATFFPIGKALKYEDAALWQEVVASGCEIGNHSWGHTYLTKLSRQKIKFQMLRTQEKVDALLDCHYPMQVMRPPMGKTNQKVEESVAAVGYLAVVKWDVSETDPVKALADVQNGSILLFHARKKDAECLVRADSAAGGGRLSAGHGVGTAGTAGNCMQRGKVRLSSPRYGGKYPPRCCSPELTTLPHSGIMKDGKRTFCCGKIKHEEE